jgi:saccharopine dehydrogenase-like NADP-dependent oxidoreductase
MTEMMRILLVGAGKVGSMIAEMLVTTGDYHVTVVDKSAESLDQMDVSDTVVRQVADASDTDKLLELMKDKYAVLSAAPFNVTIEIARAAKIAGIHYLDLTEDVKATRVVKELARDSNRAFIPQCGLAPGFISIVAYDLARKFDRLHNVHMRVGALPKYPSNGLKYNLTWSTDGLINEYCNPCEAIVKGEQKEVPPLEEMEEFSLDGISYEAFNTSGGLGTLCETLAGKVDNLNYRTVRYPGHRDIMKILIQDLRLGERRELLKDIFETALPLTLQDVVLVFVTVSGEKDGRYIQESYARKVYSRKMNHKDWSAIQITTASGICAMLDLLREGKLPGKGFVRQEDCKFHDFINNRFGANYEENSTVNRITNIQREVA